MFERTPAEFNYESFMGVWQITYINKTDHRFKDDF